MLRVAGACLILSASSLLGVQKSRQFTKRIEQLQELQRIVLLIQGEILYKNAALPEALRSSAGKVKVPFDSFLRQTAGRADAFDGVRFSDLFETEIKEQEKALKNQKYSTDFLQENEVYLKYRSLKERLCNEALFKRTRTKN